ncbi:glycoside hydrolase/phage tail family protein, partial [Litoreibacter sp.]|nr:glycoside hydrolase/phage tail family protein [Litoreibacter sp.]
EYSYRRFVLHYAYLCAAAGGVSAFCIGSEMRGLTQIRDDTGAFPAVDALQVLAGEVKAILPLAKIGYAADWSEYFGYHPQDGTNDVLFHLDPLWADPAIDFVGIDNYMPISDWRDGDTHLDASFGSLYNLDYLRANIAGGEGFDWYYSSEQDRDDQQRIAITDGAYGEDWIYRYKDLVGWWGQAHHERVGGIRAAVPTAWVPESKPIWFTELGCAAIDKGPNQPNKFIDEKSSESARPHYSNGMRDDYVQLQFLRAYDRHFSDPSNNPMSGVYAGSMVDIDKTHIWAWDARPWPEFPNNNAVWSDGENYLTGHWLSGRSSVQTLASVVAELCEYANVENYDVSGLHGIVRGYSVTDLETARASLQNLMIVFGFDAIEREGKLVFRNRDDAQLHIVDEADYVLPDDADAAVELTRAPEAELVGTVRLGYSAGEGGFESHVASARFPGDSSPLSTQNDLPIYLTAGEASATVERWLAESRVSRDTINLAVPPSRLDIKAGEWIKVTGRDGAETQYRVDRVEDGGARALEATRVERQIYATSRRVETLPVNRTFAAPVPITAQFLDLPLLSGSEIPHAPFVAASANPWPVSVAVYSAAEDSDYRLDVLVEGPSILGLTQSDLGKAIPGLWSNGEILTVRLQQGALSSKSRMQVLNGANVAAIGDGSSDNWEVFQFTNAELVAVNTYELSGLLRGQAGSDALMPDIWPAESRFALLDGSAVQIGLDLAQRDLERHYRIGAASKPYDDSSYRHYVEAFKGIGLRPYAPAHLSGQSDASGWSFDWIRRTRIDGDSWSSVDVPLGEDNESYQVRVLKDQIVLRDTTVTTSSWHYPTATALSDGASLPFEIEVAQISQSFGPGPFARKIMYV